MNFNTTCRICLQEGALYPIFEKAENEVDIVFKISLCLQVTIQDIEGYPCQICKICKDTLDVLYQFINRFKETCKVLENGTLNIKEEKDIHNNYDYVDELDVDYSISHFKDEPITIPQSNCDNQNNSNISREGAKKDDKFEKENIKSNSSPAIQPNNKEPLKIKTPTVLKDEFTLPESDPCLKSSETDLAECKTITSSSQRVRKNKECKKQNPPPPKLCDLCGEVFKDQEKLSVHKKKIHFKNPVRCPKCSRFFVSDYYLKRHIKRRHENEKHFTCATCSRAFAFKGELTSHCKNVHNKNLKPKKVFTCKICNKTYKCPKSVVVHERSVHTGDRPAVCRVCGTSFFHEDYLKEHMRLHTGETPFKCPICARGFAQRCNMKSHLRIHKVSELDETILKKLKPNYIKLLKT